ncbi:MAG: SpoIIE family protein phosphatase [Pseudomonadota bacterium]
MQVAAKDIASLAEPGGARPSRILVVDDSRLQRRILTSSLRKAGHDVLEAADGSEALEVCKNAAVDIVISDWMMPGMTGLELCRAFRDTPRAGYGYFILLTSKSEKGEIAEGLNAGADDFLTKPVNADELRARIIAGERILQMHRELTEKNRQIGENLAEISTLYEALDRDLGEARKLQQSLVPERHVQFDGSELAFALRPAGHVGGDLVGYFPIDAANIGIFAIDVSGHGVSSALMTARLAGLLSGASPSQNIALVRAPDGTPKALPPADAVRRLNDLTLGELETEHYFTLLLAQLNLETGEMVFCQAGHPDPLLRRASGAVETLGDGGLPVGLIPGADFTQHRVRLRAGDALLIYSDGVTEYEDARGAQFGDDRLRDCFAELRGAETAVALDSLTAELERFSGGVPPLDDVSGVLFSFAAGWVAPRRRKDD